MENELLNNTALITGLTAMAGTVSAFIFQYLFKKLKTFVLKTENKIDDAILKGIEQSIDKSFKKNIKKVNKK